MPLTVRKRGKYWHARGTVRWGRQVIKVVEFSTGCLTRRDAEEAAGDEERRIVQELRDGPEATARKAHLVDILDAYRDRPGGHAALDLWRIKQLTEYIGERTVGEAPAAWDAFCRMRCAALKPATTDRFRVVLMAALHRHCDAAGIITPRLARLSYSNERTRFLTEAEERRLLRAYSRPARDVARFLAGTGCRTQEALRLTWRFVDLAGQGQVIFPAANTKARQTRAVPLSRPVRIMLRRIRRQRFGDRPPPPDANVFLSHHRRPYRDTRGEGGNPISKATATACERAKITDFHPHDWRHHWASKMVMRGMDLPTLMRLGGWATLRMVQRYAAVSAAHVAEQVRRVG